ncbi:hypothetical protein PT274_01580 [Leuconostocaceae bacterium ESL0958]|nr:hypothetical protein [Leuconostocaceae bacterium ESL0958]
MTQETIMTLNTIMLIAGSLFVGTVLTCGYKKGLFTEPLYSHSDIERDITRNEAYQARRLAKIERKADKKARKAATKRAKA